MARPCPVPDRNDRRCNCTYPGCPRHGRCCDCLQYHLDMKQLPACAFDASAEATWDRSFAHFVRVQQGG